MNILTTDSGGEGSVMTNECETTLIQIQYFMAREFTMDSSLYEVCRNDAKSICKAKVIINLLQVSCGLCSCEVVRFNHVTFLVGLV